MLTGMGYELHSRLWLQYHNYHGEAINPKHLSRYERWRGYGIFYMPDRDREHKRIQLHPH